MESGRGGQLQAKVAAGIVMCKAQSCAADLHGGLGPPKLVGLLQTVDSFSLSYREISIERSTEQPGEEPRNDEMACQVIL